MLEAGEVASKLECGIVAEETGDAGSDGACRRVKLQNHADSGSGLLRGRGKADRATALD